MKLETVTQVISTVPPRLDSKATLRAIGDLSLDLEEHIHSLDISGTTMPTEVKTPLRIC
jgi:hypothetical protein